MQSAATGPSTGTGARDRSAWSQRPAATTVLGVLLLTLAGSSIAMAQQAQLRVVAIQGEGALNNLQARINQDVVVEVQDGEGMPIVGAPVTFVYPDDGATGAFPDGSRSITVNTAEDGRAAASGVRPNDETGPLQIRVAASYQGQTATLVINQTNVAVVAVDTPAAGGQPGRGMSAGAKVMLVLAIAAGAAVGGIVATNRSPGGSSSGPGTPPPISITPGTPTVGGP